MNSYTIEGKEDVTTIDSKSETNSISMNLDVNVFNKYYKYFLSPKNQEDVSTGT